MRILFHLGHPAHFHLFKNIIYFYKNNGDKIFVLIKKKDVLEELLTEANLDYFNILPSGRKNSGSGLLIGIIKQTIKLLIFSLKNRPDLFIGSTPAIAHVGKLVSKPSIILSEDDAKAVNLFAKITYPLATIILSPQSCNNGPWNYKTIKYNSYHELSYLHPNHFSPDIKILNKYVSLSLPFFLLRFSGLDAYHDKGISGINNRVALKIVKKLNKHGNVLISSEKPLSPDLEQFRLKINPSDIHHVIAYADIYLGDSQTMAAEAAVLGTPFIRVNDFVGRLGYLDELENKYQLGFGIKPATVNSIFEKIDYLLNCKNLKEKWMKKRSKMITDKLDFNYYLISFIAKNFK